MNLIKMRISVNTETEELEELRHAVAIIEDAIKRRENPDLYEEDYEQEAEEKPKKAEDEVKIEKPKQEISPPQQTTQQVQQVQQIQQIQQQQPPQSLTVEKPAVEESKPQIELNLTKPISYSQIEQTHQSQKPKPVPSKSDERGTTPDIDISALSMSSYGESKEGRKMDNAGARSSSQFSSSSSSSSFSSNSQLTPRYESRNNESHVKEIVTSLRSQRPGQPIQMSDIVGKARTRNISEQETRNLISKLQREGSI